MATSSNIRMGVSPASRATPLTRRLVEVPIRVQLPPRMAAKESGISRREGGSLRSRARLRTTGRKITTTRVLLMKAETTAADSTITMRKTPGPKRTSFFRARAMGSTAPFFSRAALRMNIAPTTIGAGLVKTAKASRGSSTPLASKTAKTERAVRSGGIFSRAKLARAPARSPIIRMISQVIPDPPGKIRFSGAASLNSPFSRRHDIIAFSHRARRFGGTASGSPIKSHTSYPTPRL